MKNSNLSNVTLVGKGFGEKKHLETHFKSVHEGIKSFKCHPCDKSLSRNFTLSQHVKEIS